MSKTSNINGWRWIECLEKRSYFGQPGLRSRVRQRFLREEKKCLFLQHQPITASLVVLAGGCPLPEVSRIGMVRVATSISFLSLVVG